MKWGVGWAGTIMACSAWCALVAAQPGTISVPSSTTNRVITVSVTPPANAAFVKLSEYPDFEEATNGVRITIANLHTNLDYADLNITYPGGVPGGRGQPGGLPATTNELRVLLIPVRLQGGVEPPSYATNGWFQRLMFNETNGPDARAVANSAKSYVEQTTYGRVRVTGDIYPEWVTVRAARDYTSLAVHTVPQTLVRDAVEAIKARTPAFFAGKRYDFVITVHGGELVAVYNSYYEQSSLYWDDPDGNFRGYMNIDLPVQTNCPLLHPISNEINSVSNSVDVRPAMRPYTVVGVWLESDTNRTGTNFFTGGSHSFNNNVITLGQPVPAGSKVQVDYTVATFYRQWRPEEPFFSSSQVGTWMGTYLHELMHGLGSHITFTDTEYIGDLYRAGDLISIYGLMAGGNHNYSGDWPIWTEPASLEAYVKYALGIVLPYELHHGENEVNLRLHAANEFPYTERTKLIKVPLNPPGITARRRFSLWDYNGDEYLLIELRKRRPVAGIHNTDSGLPHEGVLIYHVNEADQYILGSFTKNVVRIIDATPGLPSWYTVDSNPYNNLSASLQMTAAPFGFDSSRFEHVHGAQWQSIGNSNLLFRLKERGTTTIYAKFCDVHTNEIATTSTTTTFDPWPDVNSNNLDDNWEQRFFKSLGSASGAPGADPDGDGMLNRDEFAAGTNPTNRNSAVRLALKQQNGQVTTVIPSVAGVSYMVEYSRDAVRPRWISFFDRQWPTMGDGTVHEWSDFRRRVGDTRFYRVVVPER